MIWAYMIYLGNNMWNDPDSLTRFNKNDPRYYTEMYTSRDAWRKITDYLAETGFNTLVIDLGEGLQYESHPEISCKGAWSKQEMAAEIARLKTKGITCVPKINFATTHDAWMGKYARMVSTPEYYQVVGDLIDEVCELFKPPLIHLGFDEESRREIHMQNEYGYSCYRLGELYKKDLNFCIDRAEKHGVRPWLWAGLSCFHMQDFLASTPKEAVISTYNYGEIRNMFLLPDYTQQHMQAFKVLSDNGYDQIPTCSTCYDYYSVDDTFWYTLENVDRKRLLGMFTTPWYRTGDEDIYTHFADAKLFAAARNKYFPEEAVK